MSQILHGIDAVFEMNNNNTIMRISTSRKFFRINNEKLECSRTGKENSWEISDEKFNNFLDNLYQVVKN